MESLSLGESTGKEQKKVSSSAGHHMRFGRGEEMMSMADAAAAARRDKIVGFIKWNIE